MPGVELRGSPPGSGYYALVFRLSDKEREELMEKLETLNPIEVIRNATERKKTMERRTERTKTLKTPA